MRLEFGGLELACQSVQGRTGLRMEASYQLGLRGNAQLDFS